VNPKIERRRDQKHPAGTEDPIDLVEGASNLKNVFKRFDTKDGPRLAVSQRDSADVLDAIDPRSGSHIAADIAFTGEERAEIGVIELSLDLIRAELVNRAWAIERLGREAAERLVVIAHRNGSSLSPSDVHVREVAVNLAYRPEKVNAESGSKKRLKKRMRSFRNRERMRDLLEPFLLINFYLYFLLIIYSYSAFLSTLYRSLRD
jgi:hypothetical protein